MANEQCDDGNNVTNDDCTNNCTIARCGDGITWNQGAGLEECDDTNANENDNCLSTCVLATCGDGFIHNQGGGTETCDDGNANNNDNCPSTCHSATCGDGFVFNQGGGTEQCDAGADNGNVSSNCDNRCRFRCGNGLVESGEECARPDKQSRELLMQRIVPTRPVGRVGSAGDAFA